MSGFKDIEAGGRFKRIVVVDHTMYGDGRAFTKESEVPMYVKVFVQDDGQTIKILLAELSYKELGVPDNNT